MAVTFSVVDGIEFARDASAILEQAWEPPVLHYSPAYLSWQLSFPSAVEMPAVAAFDGGDPIGFAAATARRLRHGSTNFDAAIVSFVAVRPAWRGQRVAAGLYRTLLEVLADRAIPVVTYALPESAGHRALLRSYREAGFQIQPMGPYTSYAFAGRQEEAGSQWTAHSPQDAGVLSSLAPECCARVDRVLWSMPEKEQIAHYFTDPRPRKLIVVENVSTGDRGAGFGVYAELRTLQGVTRVIMLDSLWMPNPDTGALVALLRLLSAAWPSSGASPVVMCPNLSGFEASALKAVRIRRTGALLSGYFCFSGQTRWPAFERTNLEVI